jgi:hypothetical protein
VVLLVGGKRVKLPGKAAPVAREPGRKIEADRRDDEIARPRRGLERRDGRVRGARGAGSGADQNARDRADSRGRAGDRAQRPRSLGGASDDPDPDREHRHFAAAGKSHGAPDGNEQDAAQGQQNRRQADALGRVARPDR